MNAGDEMVRGLADVLTGHLYVTFGYCSGCDWQPEPWDEEDATTPYPDQHHAHVAEVLAAHVLGLVVAGKAEALREAAKELPGFDGIRTHGDAARWLRARADGLAGEAS